MSELPQIRYQGIFSELLYVQFHRSTHFDSPGLKIMPSKGSSTSCLEQTFFFGVLLLCWHHQYFVGSQEPLQLLEEYLPDYSGPGVRVKSVPVAAEEALFTTLLQHLPLELHQFAGQCGTVYDANVDSEKRFAILLPPKCAETTNASSDEGLPDIKDIWQVRFLA